MRTYDCNLLASEKVVVIPIFLREGTKLRAYWLFFHFDDYQLLMYTKTSAEKHNAVCHKNHRLPMRSIIRNMLYDCVALFFPSYCIHCQTKLLRQEQWLCTTCFACLPQIPYNEHTDSFMAQKLCGEAPIIHAFALYKFGVGNAVQQLVHHLKYKNHPGIGEMLGYIGGTQWMQKRSHNPFDCVMAIPLHPKRLRKRGYNQSEHFAKGLAAALNVPYYNQYIHRIKHTATQTKKNKIERIYNMQDAFAAIDTEPIHDQHVLLVDDVITTGATVKACAGALFNAGVKKISIAAICIV